MKSWWCRGGGGKCVSKRLTYPVVILVILISNIGVNLCSATSSAGERDEYDSWRQRKQNSLGRSLKPRYSSEKSVAKQSKHLQQQQNAVASGIEYVGKSSRGGGKKVNFYPMSPHGEVARQGGGGGGGGGGWGWGWPSHGGGGGGSYDVYTIIAVAAFAALFGALMYELMGGSCKYDKIKEVKMMMSNFWFPILFFCSFTQREDPMTRHRLVCLQYPWDWTLRNFRR